MFMQRLITTLILVPLVLIALFYGPPWFLLTLIVCVFIMIGRECWQLIPLSHLPQQLVFLVFLLGALWGCGPLFSYWLLLGIVFWVGIFMAVLTFPKSQRYWGHAFVVALTLIIVLPLFLQSFIHLYEMPQGKPLILYSFCLVWAADIGAYLAGKCWGKHKLIPQVSPGKSWEGAAGGFIGTLIVAVIGLFYFQPPTRTAWFGVAVLITVISILGDLFISILKRRCHLKDTGTLIPGHGGILDRLDSLIAALPFFYLGVKSLIVNVF